MTVYVSTHAGFHLEELRSCYTHQHNLQCSPISVLNVLFVNLTPLSPVHIQFLSVSVCVHHIYYLTFKFYLFLLGFTFITVTTELH